jgi:hypothetical protein
MIFDQNRGSERSWTNIDPVGVTILLPSEDFVLLNHSTFKPFECYSDRLLVHCLANNAWFTNLCGAAPLSCNPTPQVGFGRVRGPGAVQEDRPT